VTKKVADEGWTGFMTGAALMGFAWALAANWHLTFMLLTSPRFYMIGGVLVALNAYAAWSRIRASRRQIMVALPEHSFQLHLRERSEPGSWQPPRAG